MSLSSLSSSQIAICVVGGSGVNWALASSVVSMLTLVVLVLVVSVVVLVAVVVAVAAVAVAVDRVILLGFQSSSEAWSGAKTCKLLIGWLWCRLGFGYECCIDVDVGCFGFGCLGCCFGCCCGCGCCCCGCC